ncbi:MAG: histidine--tRNA ligase [Candidatus Cardinium sp.]|nr:histidine--tRNA ligase [Candidatus Cardinium sp.]
MAIRSTLVKGTRDYSAEEIYRRNYILSVIQSVYALYGFEPLETPAIESWSTLAEKYGEEGEQLMFHILKSGDFLKNISLEGGDYAKIKPLISDKGLRYDLTIPLVRYIAMHRHQLCFPFKRYQIQTVWRADRPQRGRYREFLQCDIDIVGSEACLCEAEILKIIYDVLTKLQLRNFHIKINHRGILSAIVSKAAQATKEIQFCTIIDKLAKIGWEQVVLALKQEGFDAEIISLLDGLVHFKGSDEQLLEQLQTAIGSIDKGAMALNLLTQTLTQAHHLGLPAEICHIDPTLARGLAYYTGMVMEVMVADSNLGSLGGGGRYDQLGACFGLDALSGVGFSFGINRLYAIMEEQQLFQSTAGYTTEILLVNMETTATKRLLQMANQLRIHGLSTELYPQCVKLQKQLVYAHKKKIPFVILLGEQELATDSYTLKNMQTGLQMNYSWPDLMQVLQKKLRA